jgi:hypothetical protein
MTMLTMLLTVWNWIAEGMWGVVESVFGGISLGFIESPAAFWPLVVATAVATVGLAITSVRFVREVVLLCGLLPPDHVAEKILLEYAPHRLF